jgi:hypothetical protein
MRFLIMLTWDWATPYDATSRAARRVLAPLSRAGVTKAAKTIMHKRERRNFRQQLANSRVLV